MLDDDDDDDDDEDGDEDDDDGDGDDEDNDEDYFSETLPPHLGTCPAGLSGWAGWAPSRRSHAEPGAWKSSRGKGAGPVTASRHGMMVQPSRQPSRHGMPPQTNEARKPHAVTGPLEPGPGPPSAPQLGARSGWAGPAALRIWPARKSAGLMVQPSGLMVQPSRHGFATGRPVVRLRVAHLNILGLRVLFLLLGLRVLFLLLVRPPLDLYLRRLPSLRILRLVVRDGH